MFSSSLLPVDRTWLPATWRQWAGRHLSGPPPGTIEQRFAAGIFQLDRLGDFVLALSAIRRLLATWGAERCLLVVSAAAAPLAAKEFPRTPRIVLPVNAPSLTRNLVPIWWRQRPKFQGLFCERVICLSHHRDLYKAVALSWLKTERVHQLTRETYPTEMPAGWCLELAAHHRLLETVLEAPVPRADIQPRLESLSARDGDELLVYPFASEKIRDLGAEQLLGTLTKWREQNSARIVIGSSPVTSAAAEELAASARRRGLASVEAGVTESFEALAARIANAGAVLANESGPAHLATALDKRAVVIVGGGTFTLCAPWQRSPRQTFLNARVPCYGCGWRCDQPEVYCLTRISSEAIAAALPSL